MNDETERPLATRAPQAAAAPADPPAAGLGILPWACGIGFVLLACGLYFEWQNPNLPPAVTAATSQLRAAQARLEDLDARLTRLEQRPAPVPPPPAPAPAGNSAEVARLAARLDAAEARATDPTQLNTRIDTLSGRIEALAVRLGTGLDAAKQQADAVAARVAGLEKSTTSVASVSDRVAKLARLQDAAIALASGRPVGELPNAPPALARFAHDAPPTDSQLRLSFAEAERLALAADQPTMANGSLADRMWEKAQALVTVKRGEEVVIGNTSAVLLGQAKAALDAGDLKLALSALAKLADAPKQAMAGWIGQARALEEARTALAGMAGQA